MDSTHPTAGWEKVGDRFYRKIQLYTAVFDLDLDLDNFFVAGAPYGGAVGVFPRLWLHFGPAGEVAVACPCGYTFSTHSLPQVQDSMRS